MKIGSNPLAKVGQKVQNEEAASTLQHLSRTHFEGTTEMKKIIVAMLLMTPPVHATDVNQYCSLFGDNAAKIMELRQANVPMSTLMSLFSEGNSESQAHRDLTRRAYSMPGYHVAENQTRAVAEFRNMAELLCYQVNKGE